MKHEETRKMDSVELIKSHRNNDDLREEVQKYFENPKRMWSKGKIRKSFNILLLDPRITENIPAKANNMRPFQSSLYQKFINAIFFVGKGTRTHSLNKHSHSIKARRLWAENKRKSDNQKNQVILDICSENYGVVCLIVFQNSLLEECETHEAALIDFIGLSNLKNEELPQYHDCIADWPEQKRRRLGSCLLRDAFGTYVTSKRERQLRPKNIRLKK